MLMSTSHRNYETMKSELDILKKSNKDSTDTSASVQVTNTIPLAPIVQSSTASHSCLPTTDCDTKTPKPTLPPSIKTEVEASNYSASFPQEPDTTNTSPNNQFGQNEFSVAVSNNTKMKFSIMESSLKDCILISDSQRDMKTFYEGVTKSITFLLNQELDLIPSFKELHRKIDFQSLFLANLHSATLTKCKPIFTRFGTLIRARLLAKDCVDPKKCPKAALKILTHSLMDGWKLFETILKPV